MSNKVEIMDDISTHLQSCMKPVQSVTCTMKYNETQLSSILPEVRIRLVMTWVSTPDQKPCRKTCALEPALVQKRFTRAA